MTGAQFVKGLDRGEERPRLRMFAFLRMRLWPLLGYARHDTGTAAGPRKVRSREGAGPDKFGAVC